MNLDKKNILHLASLSKLKLGDQEVEEYARQLSDILAYVEKISKLNLKNIKESLSGVDQKDYMPPRPDQVEIFNPETIRQAPGLQDNYVVVPHVFENNQK